MSYGANLNIVGEAEHVGTGFIFKLPVDMRVRYLNWCHHSSSTAKAVPLYCADISPADKRLATGGADGFVNIWSCDNIFGSAGDTEPLCRLPCSGVRSLKWSPDGFFLACASDDHVVRLYCLDTRSVRKRYNLLPSAQSSKSSNTPEQSDAPKEPYVVGYTLRGHSAEVSAVCWGSDGRWLATASLDGAVCVWDIAHAHESSQTRTRTHTSGICISAPIHTHTHTGAVCDIRFDPFNRLLVVLSTNGVVEVWRCGTWEQEMELRDVCLPVGSGSVLRCDWSPDGCAVTVPHSQLRTKETDDSPAGQRALTTSATLQRDMCPKLFRAGAGPVADGKAWSGQYACVMCVGSVDGCVSIWSNTHSHARAAITHAFAAAVTDITWAHTRPSVLCVSADGAALVCDLTPSELGAQLTAAETDAALEQMSRGAYAPLAVYKFTHPAADLDAEEAVHILTPVRKAIAHTLPGGRGALQAPPPVQFEERTADGKRRIRPNTLGLGSAPAPFPQRSPPPTAAAAAPYAPPTAAVTGGVTASALTPPAAADRLTAQCRAPDGTRYRCVWANDSSGKACDVACTCSSGGGGGGGSALTPVGAAEQSLWGACLFGRALSVAAVATPNGCVAVCGTACGRLYLLGTDGELLLPPLALGFAVCAVAVAWEGEASPTPRLRVCAVTADACARVWRVPLEGASAECTARDSLLPALAATAQGVSAQAALSFAVPRVAFSPALRCVAVCEVTAPAAVGAAEAPQRHRKRSRSRPFVYAQDSAAWVELPPQGLTPWGDVQWEDALSAAETSPAPVREGDETLTDPKRMRLLSAAERAAELAASVASDGPAGGVGHTPRARTAASEIRLAAAALSGGREALLRALEAHVLQLCASADTQRLRALCANSLRQAEVQGVSGHEMARRVVQRARKCCQAQPHAAVSAVLLELERLVDDAQLSAAAVGTAQ